MHILASALNELTVIGWFGIYLFHLSVAAWKKVRGLLSVGGMLLFSVASTTKARWMHMLCAIAIWVVESVRNAMYVGDH